ncbi:MAG: glycosyltransferase family 2 protein [Caulobacteraceae bacterium]|nr:glycosyltransferase family 2 protein [Caulobacteraceae bacterium]
MSVLDAHSVVFEGGSGAESSPRVTVVISLYNYAHVVGEALDTVAAQTLADLDLIVVDDCSRDDSGAVVTRWMKTHAGRFNRCTLYRNDRNLGLATTRNIALGHVMTEFCFMLDADNCLYPRAIEKLLGACDASRAEAAYCQLELFGDESEVGSAAVLSRERLKRGNYIDAMALLRTATLRDCGGYGLFEIAGWEDYDLWCTFVDKGLNAAFLPEILCRYRVHGASMLRSETNKEINSVELEITARHPWLELDR